MIFDKVFLQSLNDHCLGQVLSFLTCRDLANAGRTCKVLNRTIFDDDKGNVNLIWQGAEEVLTNPGDKRQDIFDDEGKIRRDRVGPNAREHCHLFAVASKAAKAYAERLGGIEEDRIKVDGVLADLMNVRGFDSESIAEKKAIGAANTQTMEEASAEITESDWAEESEETKQRRLKEWEQLAQEAEPAKTYHHSIFVRITSRATGEMISEGFCGWYQKHPWYEGLHHSRGYYGMAQGLHIKLDFESLSRSEEMQTFIGAVSTPERFKWTKIICERGGGLGFNMTAVVIDRRNHGIRCLFTDLLGFSTGTNRLASMGPSTGCGILRNLPRVNFRPYQRSGLKNSVQLGPSISQDSYFLRFCLSLGVAEDETNGGPIVVPLLEVDVEQDRYAINRARAIITNMEDLQRQARFDG